MPNYCQLSIYYIQKKGNLDWYNCGHFKNKGKEIDCLSCRMVDAMLTVSAKIPECEGSILPPSIYGHLSARLLVKCVVNLIYLVDDLFFLFLV